MSMTYHPSFSGPDSSHNTGHDIYQAQKLSSLNQRSQHQKTTTELASPVAHSDLAATGLPPVGGSSSRSLLYPTYHYSGNNTSSTSPKILPASFTLPETLFRVPKRWHQTRLISPPRLLAFAPSVQPPPVTFVARPSRLHPVERWRAHAYDWQKQPASTVPAREYRDIGGWRWRWPSPLEVIKGLLGVKRGE